MIPQAVSWYCTKGGVGKSTHTAHHAVMNAANGWRVLVVDLDFQGNLARLLGYLDHPDYDGGTALVRSLLVGDPPRLLRAVGGREGLDAIGAGPEARGLAELLAQRSFGSDRLRWRHAFDDLLQPLAGEYHLVLLDLPPTPSPLHEAALTTTHYVVIPTKTDDLEIDGVANALKLLDDIRAISNPDLEVLGIVGGLWDPKATRRLEAGRAGIAELRRSLGLPGLKLYEPWIRLMPGTSGHMVAKGWVTTEYEALARSAKADRLRWLRQRVGERPEAFNDRGARALADDYLAVLAQVNEDLSARLEAWGTRVDATGAVG